MWMSGDMKDLILFGNPNTGKTTLFNTLTRSGERATNWHGVTVEAKSKKVELFGEKLTVFDLPGLYSICGVSEEERIAVDVLKQYSDDENSRIVLVCDCLNLYKNLFLAFELADAGVVFDICLNMVNEFGGDLKSLVSVLEKQFLCCVVCVDGRKRKSVLSGFECVVVGEKRKNDGVLFDFIKNRNYEQNAEKIHIKITKLLENIDFGKSKTEKLNFWLNKSWVSVLLFLVLGLGVFFVAFGPIGTFLSGLVERYLVGGLFDWFACRAYEFVPWLGELIDSVLVFGVGSVLCFLPQVVLLFGLLGLMEDCGFLARVALALDGPCSRLGLSGRSVFSLLSGLGCTTSAVLVTRNLENIKLRRRTALALPFFGCSAKVPVLLVIASLFFEKYKFLCVFGVYLLSFLVFLGLFLIFECFGGSKKKNAFLMELPRFRWPNIKKICGDSVRLVGSFCGRTLGAVAACCFGLFVLKSFDFSFAYVGDGSGKSILETVAGFVAPVFAPLGFGCYGVVVALCFGLVAKEMLLSSLAMVNGVEMQGLALSLAVGTSAVCFGPASAVSFLIFVMLFTPCVPAIVMIGKEIDRKTAVFCAFLQFFVAYVVALFAFRIACGDVVFLWILIAFVVAFCVFGVIKCMLKKRGCYGCFGGTCAHRRRY